MTENRQHEGPVGEAAQSRTGLGSRDLKERAKAAKQAMDAAPRPHIGILEQREIEARVIAPIYFELAERIGEGQAREIIGKAITADAEAAGRDFRKGAEPGREMRHFIDIQEYWEADDALDAEHVLETDDRYSYTVHHCGYADMYRRLGIPELGAILSCARDFAFARGYDPNLELSRPQTIMEGADHCPFQYVLKRTAEQIRAAEEKKASQD